MQNDYNKMKSYIFSFCYGVGVYKECRKKKHFVDRNCQYNNILIDSAVEEALNSGDFFFSTKRASKWFLIMQTNLHISKTHRIWMISLCLSKILAYGTDLVGNTYLIYMNTEICKFSIHF